MTIRRAVVLAVATACSARPVVAPVPPPAAPPADAQVATSPDAAPVPVPPAFARIEAPPVGAIRMLAVTLDGTAAVTADELGGVRLWPALDGSAEPVIVDLPVPSALAIAPVGASYAIAMLDDAGGAIVAEVDRDGRVVRHAAIEPTGGPRFTGVVASDERFLLWSEQALVLVSSDGGLVNTLTSQRVVEVATAPGRAVGVVVDKDGKRRTRWIGFVPLSWDEAIAGGDGLASVAVTPDGERLAGIAGGRAIVMDLGTNKQLASAPAPAHALLGFAGDRVAIAGPNGSLAWIGGGAGLAATKDASPAMLAGGDRAITARGGDLVLATPAAVKYLGYGVSDLSAAPADGALLAGRDDHWQFLDAKLDLVGAAMLAEPKGHVIHSFARLAGDDWLVLAQTPTGTNDVFVANVATGAMTKVHSRRAITFVETNPGSDLVTFGNGSLADSELFRYANHTLVRVALAKDSGLGALYPVAPALANGAQLVRVSYSADTDDGHLRWIHDVDHPERGAVDLDIKRYAVPAVDAAGRVYVTTNDGGTTELAIYADGKLVKSGLDFGHELAPAPASGRFAMLGVGEITLHGPDGAPLWTRPVPNHARPIWLDDHHLVATAWPGLIAIDADTGAIARTRCGWRFGLMATPNPSPTAIATACTRLADARGDHVAVPGDVAFQSAMREVAGAATIAEWGVAPINGVTRRFAVIVSEPDDLMDSVVGYIVEVAPGSYVEASFNGWGIVQPNYAGELVADPVWTVGAAATAAREDRFGNRISKYANDGFAFEKRWIHMSGEEFHFTVRGDTFVVSSWDWIERERDNTGMHSTGDRKTYSKGGMCGAACPKLAGHQSYAEKFRVVGPTRDLAALTVRPAS